MPIPRGDARANVDHPAHAVNTPLLFKCRFVFSPSSPLSMRMSGLAVWLARTAAKRGVRFGPKPRLAPHQERDATRIVRDQGLSLRAVAHHTEGILTGWGVGKFFDWRNVTIL